MSGAARPLRSARILIAEGRQGAAASARSAGSWLAAHRLEAATVAALLVVGAVLRPAAAQATVAPVSVAPQYGRAAVTAWFGEVTGAYLVPVTRRVEEGTVNPRHALEALLAGPAAGPELRALFPDGVTIATFETRGSEAVVDLSAGALDRVDAALAVDAAVLSITESGAIAAVRLSVGGIPVDADGRAAASSVALPRPVPNPETPAATAGGVELYFAYGVTDQYLVPVTRADAVADAGEAIAQLLAGPAAGSSLRPALPLNVGVINWRREGALAVVNVDEQLIYAYRLSKANALYVRKAIMATLTRLPGVEAGMIEINGSRMLMYTCVNVTQEFAQARPWALNDEFYLSALP
jgi:spore germination protein GerM